MTKLLKRLQSGYYHVDISYPLKRPRVPGTDAHSSEYPPYIEELQKYVDSLKKYEETRPEQIKRDKEFWDDLYEQYSSAGLLPAEKQRLKEILLSVRIEGIEQYRVWYKMYSDFIGYLTRFHTKT